MKQLITRHSVFFHLILFISLIFTACEKNESDSPNPVTPSGATLKTTVTGRITDTNGNIMSGVTVKMGSITTVTDSRGYFLFVNADVPKDRFVLIASKSGYFNCVSGKKTQSGDANYINLVMEELPTVAIIQSSTGGVVHIQGGATINFPANAFVDQNGNVYNGQVNVYSRHFNPGEANFEAIIPGGDLLGLNTLGEEQSLFSLGMIEAKLYDNTGINEVKLAQGVTATLKFPIDPSQNAVAQSTIPMWHLDEATGIWQEEGQGTKLGNFYIANVSHFSTWNCDYSGERTDIKGLVVDCQNNPMANIVVTINGFQNVTTDNLGVFTTWVPVGYLIECQVLQMNNPILNLNSPVQSITAVAGQLNNIPTLIIPCSSRIAGNITNCSGTTPSPAMVYISWNNGVQTMLTVQFTTTGNYNIFVPENTSITIDAFNSGLTGSQSLQSGTVGTVTNAPDLLLCNSSPIGQNNFTITNNGISTLYSFNNISDESAYFDDINLDGIPDYIYISIQGTVVPGNLPCTYYMEIFDYQPGVMIYNLSSVNNLITISLGFSGYGSEIDSVSLTTNSVQFTDFGVPGTQCYGTYEFDSFDNQFSGAFTATHQP